MPWAVSARRTTRRTSSSAAGRSTTTKGGWWRSSSRSSPKGLRTRSPEGDQFGQKVTMFYDPRGQVIRTVNPDGSEQRVIFGVPGTIATPDLTDPDVFEPTPWEAYTYDANDNAGRTHCMDGPADPTHLEYPQRASRSMRLGRTVKTVERNGPNPSTDWFIDTLHLRHPRQPAHRDRCLGRQGLPSTPTTSPIKPLRIENIDAGIRRIVLDAAGNEVERRDSKGALILQAYDVLNRPIRLWARDDAGSAVTLRERLVYGDGSADRRIRRKPSANARPIGSGSPQALRRSRAADLRDVTISKAMCWRRSAR